MCVMLRRGNDCYEDGPNENIRPMIDLISLSATVFLSRESEVRFA